MRDKVLRCLPDLNQANHRDVLSQDYGRLIMLIGNGGVYSVFSKELCDPVLLIKSEDRRGCVHYYLLEERRQVQSCATFRVLFVWIGTVLQ